VLLPGCAVHVLGNWLIPVCNFINSLISWVCSFTESDLSDTDNIASLKNTTPINLINLLCVLYFDIFSLINRSGIFKRYNVVADKYDSVNECTKKINQ